MVNLVERNLDIQKMTLLGTLLVINVHLRDVIDEFISKNVSNEQSFEWYK
jgi:hypothetical protein